MAEVVSAGYVDLVPWRDPEDLALPVAMAEEAVEEGHGSFRKGIASILVERWFCIWCHRILLLFRFLQNVKLEHMV